jgi:hypothetical protein
MAIIIKTNAPAALLEAIKTEIDEGNIVTWSYDQAGDFTHNPDQWKFNAWLRPQLAEGELRFGIIKNSSLSMSTVIYGLYHGRFIELLLTHFDSRFTSVQATANKAEPDLF